MGPSRPRLEVDMEGRKEGGDGGGKVRGRSAVRVVSMLTPEPNNGEHCHLLPLAFLHRFLVIVRRWLAPWKPFVCSEKRLSDGARR